MLVGRLVILIEGLVRLNGVSRRLGVYQHL